jgi:hypothetical protein
MIEQYFDQEGFPDKKDQNGIPMIEINFADAQKAQVNVAEA